jgi:hypothetical protein
MVPMRAAPDVARYFAPQRSETLEQHVRDFGKEEISMIPCCHVRTGAHHCIGRDNEVSLENLPFPPGGAVPRP